MSHDVTSCFFPREMPERKLNKQDTNTINGAFERGVSVADIAKTFGVSKACIRKRKQRWNQTKDLPPRIILPMGKVKGRMCNELTRSIYADSSTSCRKLAGLLNASVSDPEEFVCHETVRRYLSKKGLVRKPGITKPPLNDRTISLREQFVDRWLVDGKDILGDVIWTDETMVRSHPNNHKQLYWCHEDTKRQDLPTHVKKHSQGFGVMFWGCFSKHGVGPFLALEGSMDGLKYIEVLKEELLPELQYMKDVLNLDIKMMQDNAPCHRSKIVTRFLTENNVEFIDWPPYSPDMNPIENLWAWMKQELYKKNCDFEDANQLIDAMYAIWDSITVEMCQNFCGNYEKRLMALKKAKGGYTKY